MILLRQKLYGKMDSVQNDLNNLKGTPYDPDQLRQYISQQPQKKEHHYLRNGLLATAGAGLLYRGARKGMLGNSIRKNINQFHMNVGSKLNSSSMIKNGAIDKAAAEMRLNGVSKKDVKSQMKTLRTGMNQKYNHNKSDEGRALKAKAITDMKKTDLYKNYQGVLSNTNSVNSDHAGKSMLQQVNNIDHISVNRQEN